MLCLLADGIHISKNGLEIALLCIAIVIGLLFLLARVRR